MIDPATPKALRVIAAAMREPLYQTDMHGIEALVLDNAAKEIDKLSAALRQIRSHIDCPEHYNKHINDIIDAAIGPELPLEGK